MTRSATLLTALLADGTLSLPHIARALECVESDLPTLARGEPTMPLGMQLRLAVLVIAEVPPLARSAHALKSQVEAATSFQARRPTSSDRPGWPKGRGK